MKIYPTVADFNAAEGATAKAQMIFNGAPESDWGYRLRGAGAPGGRHGWLVTFLNADPHIDPFSVAGPRSTGWLLAYEIVNNSKTGRVGLIRRDWNGPVDAAERTKAQSQPSWNTDNRNDDGGEYDIDQLDRELPGEMIV